MVFCSLMNENTGLQTWDFIGRKAYEFDGTYTPDWYVGGVEFNADREHINGPALNSILPAGSNGTILFGYKNTVTPASYYYFFTTGDGYTIFSMFSDAAGVSVYINGSGAAFSGLSNVQNSKTIGIKWEDVGSQISVDLYLDGIYIDTASTGTVNFPDSSELFNIGGRPNADGRYAGGIIEWFYIWKKVLSGADVFQVSSNPYTMFEDTEVVPVLYAAAGAENPWYYFQQQRGGAL